MANITQAPLPSYPHTVPQVGPDAGRYEEREADFWTYVKIPSLCTRDTSVCSSWKPSKLLTYSLGAVSFRALSTPYLSELYGIPRPLMYQSTYVHACRNSY